MLDALVDLVDAAAGRCSYADARWVERSYEAVSVVDGAIEAVEIHGVLRGSLLSLKRLGRCRPLAKHGFDPVPHRFGD